MTPGLIALEQFQPLSRSDSQVFQSVDCVEHQHLPLYTPPELTRNATSSARVPFAKQIDGRVVAERLNHT